MASTPVRRRARRPFSLDPGHVPRPRALRESTAEVRRVRCFLRDPRVPRPGRDRRVAIRRVVTPPLLSASGRSSSSLAVIVCQHPDRSGSVGAPHAALKAESIEDAAKRIPDVCSLEEVVRERASPEPDAFGGTAEQSRINNCAHDVGLWSENVHWPHP